MAWKARDLPERKRFLLRAVIFLFCAVFLTAYARAEGDVEALNDFEYWDNGKVKSCTMYDSRGRLKARASCRDDGTIEKIEKYDASANRIEEALYDQKGKLKTGIDGWAAKRWWYEDSQLVSQITYDEEGHPMERRYYSESGRLVLRQYRDSENIDPYEGAAMAILLGNRNISYRDPRVQE